MNLTQELLIIIGAGFLIYWSYWLYKNKTKPKTEPEAQECKTTDPINP